ncbi:ABC transporter substrate-binding protein [Polyangium jinanense]|uniref:ABC transporter substrate-binding protein n=1 Tax=Polyangium jinanense TaxID=2829994 RepID=A0A9X4AW59_9BACT|nr:ABC transporter substrate-binding protein [Polyangium jinanense]MDC3957530.1 ABC transporter substrate-binding protein [Polyangium jinanense]MDC3984980.1 ABC transporter substrate-binding protein [Polyangium jinanense]
MTLRIVYVPIACSMPLLYAASRGFFEQKGLSVELRRAPSWDAVRRLLTHDKVDAAHVLAPLALATGLGIDGRAAPIRVRALQNQNGSTLVLGKNQGRITAPHELVGKVLGVPHRFSMQYYLLCDWLARGGVNPLIDLTIREVPPPRMPRWLALGRIDGAMFPEPFAQLVVDRGGGVACMQSREVWRGHPCCTLSFGARFWREAPERAAALLEAVVEAQVELDQMDPEGRRAAAGLVVARGYLPAEACSALEKALAGEPMSPSDALGPDRLCFAPTPFVEYGVWILAQMQRWGQLAGDVEHLAAARAIFEAEPARGIAARLGMDDTVPELDGVRGFSFDDPLGAVRAAPFCAHRTERPSPPRATLSEPARERIHRILDRLADMAWGAPDLGLSTFEDDELGELERALDESIRARAFAEEALVEHMELEEAHARQDARIEAQRTLIRELAAPLAPVLPGVLLLPLVGRIDRERAADIEERALRAAWERSARRVIIDVTGARLIDEEAIALVLRLSRALRLIGAECLLVGVSPEAARILAASPDPAGLPRCVRDLSAAIGAPEAAFPR